MNKVRIIFPFVLLFFITLAGQEKTSILNCSYYNGITNKEQFVETIEIQNLSSSPSENVSWMHIIEGRTAIATPLKPI